MRGSRWRDRRGITHGVTKGHLQRGGSGPWYVPVCRVDDPTIVWPHPKYCLREIDCMSCIATEALQ